MDRGRERERDRRNDSRGDGEVTRMGGGESYRPNARPRSPPPRADTFRASDRERRPSPVIDTYHSDRRRASRSPGFRRDRTPPRDSGIWRARPRSPPRARSPPRRFSPRRVDDRRDRARSPRRDERRRSRSPFDRDRTSRARSPLSPRRSRSPPAASRPSWRPRSRTPERRDDRPPAGPTSATWRRRSPSPTHDSSGRTSGNTSRRSSPHIHPSRINIAPTLSREVRARSPPRPRSPPTQFVYREREPDRSTPKTQSPAHQTQPKSPPRAPASLRAPTGPSSGRNFAIPSSRSPIAVSAQNKSENTGFVAPPAGPRGYVPPVRGAYVGRGGGRGSFGSDRQSRPDWGAAPPSRPAVDTSTRGSTPSKQASTPSPAVSSRPSPSPAPTGPSNSIPTGPRAGASSSSRPVLQHSSSVYGSRTSSISTPSGPRPHPAMAGLAQIIPGGKIDPTASGVTPDVAARLKKREEEEQALRDDLKAKEEKLRDSLNNWDKLSRESSSMALRSELSERHVRMLAGEGVGGAAF